MTLSDQFLTLIAFPFCFVIQLVTIDKVVSNYLISGDDIISNYPIGWRGVSLANTPSGDNLVPCHPGLQSSVNELRICNHEWLKRFCRIRFIINRALKRLNDT